MYSHDLEDNFSYYNFSNIKKFNCDRKFAAPHLLLYWIRSIAEGHLQSHTP